MPKVSIGLPVYNGEDFLAEAISCFLAQSFTDFELIICDNASTDDTERIARSFADKDRRIRYHRNSSNVGAAANFNLAFELSTGEYFKWAAHDDLCGPEYLARCVESLEKNRDIVLCQSAIKIIDSNGNPLPDHPHLSFNLQQTDASSPHVRFSELILVKHPCYDVFGLIRSDILAQTPLIAKYSGSDRTLLAELGLHGPFHNIPEQLFFPREHPNRSIRKYQGKSDKYIEWFDTSKRNKITLLHWRFFWEFIKSTNRVKLKATDRLKCYISILKYFKWNRKILQQEIRELRPFSFLVPVSK